MPLTILTALLQQPPSSLALVLRGIMQLSDLCRDALQIPASQHASSHSRTGVGLCTGAQTDKDTQTEQRDL